MARLLKVPSELGKQLDSLADMVTFGVAPGIIVFSILGGPLGIANLLSVGSITSRRSSILIDLLGGSSSFLGKNLAYIAFLIPIFALFRLAKFNLDTRQTDSFIGLPTPAMTLFFAVIPVMVLSPIGFMDLSRAHLIQYVLLNPDFLVSTTVLFSILMVAEIPLFALKFKHFKWKGNEIRFIFLTISVGMLAILFFWAVPLIIILYVILSLINNRILKTKQDE
jgi:CDP-diacylglycerol--serine O-phosphatidyltransferase